MDRGDIYWVIVDIVLCGYNILSPNDIGLRIHQCTNYTIAPSHAINVYIIYSLYQSVVKE